MSRYQSGSRVGNRPLVVPEGVSVSIENVPLTREDVMPSQKLLVRGKMGTLAVVIPPGLICSVSTPSPGVKQYLGTGCNYMLLNGKHLSAYGMTVITSLFFRKYFRSLVFLSAATQGSKTSPETIALHGTTGALIQNMIRGVSQGFSKRLVLKGVGYRARLSERGLELSVGYSHPVCVYPPSDLDIVLESPTAFTIRGLRRDRVADFAARVRSVRPPEPYKGKGIAYEGEKVRRKAGKSGKPGR